LYAKGIVHNQSKSNVIDAGGMIKKLCIKRKRKKHLDYLIDYFFFDKYAHSLVIIKKNSGEGKSNNRYLSSSFADYFLHE
jgi:hypothetical protein